MSVGKDLIGSLQEAIEHAHGTPGSARETALDIPLDVDVRAIRERLGLSQTDFAGQFGFSVGTLRHWEQGRRHPEGPTRAYLKVIDNDPEAVRAALQR